MNVSMMSKDLPAEVIDWVESVAEGPVVACDRIVGGASRLSYSLRFAPSAKLLEAFLRVDSGTGPTSGTPFTLEREVRAVRALSQTSVRLPAVYAYSREHSAVLMEKITGTTDVSSVSDAQQAVALQDALLCELVALHRANVDLKEAFGADAPVNMQEALQHEVRLWSELYRMRVPVPEPAISVALDWLLRAAPGSDRAPVFVHGDIGPGNFLFDGTSILALIDWELAHPGHPLEDLACIIARTLGMPFGDLRRHVRAYGELSGMTVEYDELDYCLVLVLTRFCIGISMGIGNASLAVDMAVLVKFLQVNLRALIMVLARLAGIGDSTHAVPPKETSAAGPLLQYIAATLEQQIRPTVEDSFLVGRLEGVNGLLAYLRKLSDHGASLYADELRALEKLLGVAVASVAEGRVALPRALATASESQRLEVLEWLVQRSAHEHMLMKELLGPMYDRVLVY